MVAVNPRNDAGLSIVLIGGLDLSYELYLVDNAVDNAGVVSPGVAGMTAVRAFDGGGKGSGLPFDVSPPEYCAAGGAFNSYKSSKHITN